MPASLIMYRVSIAKLWVVQTRLPLYDKKKRKDNDWISVYIFWSLNILTVFCVYSFCVCMHLVVHICICAFLAWSACCSRWLFEQHYSVATEWLTTLVRGCVAVKGRREWGRTNEPEYQSNPSQLTLRDKPTLQLTNLDKWLTEGLFQRPLLPTQRSFLCTNIYKRFATKHKCNIEYTSLLEYPPC